MLYRLSYRPTLCENERRFEDTTGHHERIDIEHASRLAAAFRKQLLGVKRRLGSNDLRWYPYDTLQVFSVLERLLTGDHRYLTELAGGRPVLDIGCGDGDMSFFLESLGCQVHALDLPATNFNQMRGVAALKQALNSPLQIFEMDLDELAALPHKGYGLTICLGLLYHLKNPYSLLERLARITHYCLLSTRVARYTPDHQTDLRELPVAYLLDEREANDDPTNFWVFSEIGLKRILKRTGWQICGWTSNGCSDDSDPASTDRDQRVFCLLKSPVFERNWEVTLLDGWHAMEAGDFRWTGRQFGVRLQSRQAGACRALSFDFFLPEAHLERLGPLTLRAAINGCELPAQTFRHAGQNRYSQRFPEGAVAGGVAEIQFSLDKAAAPTPEDRRELGLVVSFARPGCAVADLNLPLELE
jgi:tRNA (mo5U34)-methyltransferase